jgi:hypothetical protein
LIRLHRFSLWGGEWIEAVDINPLMLGKDGAVAVDTLVVPSRRPPDAVRSTGEKPG